MRNQAETLFASAVPASPNYLANSSFVESGQRAAFTQLPAQCVTVFALSTALTPTQAHMVSLPMWGQRHATSGEGFAAGDDASSS